MLVSNVSENNAVGKNTVLSRLNNSETVLFKKWWDVVEDKPMHFDDELIFAVLVKIVQNLRLHFFKTASEKSSLHRAFFLL